MDSWATYLCVPADLADEAASAIADNSLDLVITISGMSVLRIISVWYPLCEVLTAAGIVHNWANIDVRKRKVNQAGTVRFGPNGEEVVAFSEVSREARDYWKFAMTEGGKELITDWDFAASVLAIPVEFGPDYVFRGQMHKLTKTLIN